MGKILKLVGMVLNTLFFKAIKWIIKCLMLITNAIKNLKEENNLKNNYTQNRPLPLKGLFVLKWNKMWYIFAF